MYVFSSLSEIFLISNVWFEFESWNFFDDKGWEEFSILQDIVGCGSPDTSHVKVTLLLIWCVAVFDILRILGFAK